jgi:hypothetical protein
MESGSDVATINSYIRKICPYFEDLNPIMEDKASTRPLYSNEDSDVDEETDDRTSVTTDDSAKRKF